VDISGAQGELEEEIFRVIKTRPGQATTRSQLQEDVNAIFATGYFSSVNVQPEDTPLGVRVTFVVEPNPVLRNVSVQTVRKEPVRVYCRSSGREHLQRAVWQNPKPA
jgi:outer membrane protein insertion porin family